MNKYYGVFHEAHPGQIKPQGLMLDILKRQENGLSGHFKVQGYPFDTKMWVGGVENANGKVDAWWPYEQASYLLDGLERLGVLLDNGKMLATVAENLRYLAEHPRSDGGLGGDFYPSKSNWPISVIFRAFWIYYQTTHDSKALDAFLDHYRKLDVPALDYDCRDVTAVEGLVKLYELTGDEALKRKALDIYSYHNHVVSNKDFNFGELCFDQLKEGRRISMHGVTASEEMKLPVILFLATGDRRFLDGAVKGLEKIISEHEQASGMVSANEFFSGRDPGQCYEMCVITDFTWCLGYFVMATGRVDLADRIEKIIFNALQGAIYKDFSRLQYFSGVNQVVATPYSHFDPSFQEKQQYRPNHFPECCGGNMHRAMPNYVLRSWMLDSGGAPAAVFYGASDFSLEYRGSQVLIEERTGYPFDEKIEFAFKTSTPVEMPFSCRIPAWCSTPEIRVNGRKIRAKVAPGTFCKIKRMWRSGDTVGVILPMSVNIRVDRQFHSFEYGPLVFAYPVDAREERGEAANIMAVTGKMYPLAPLSKSELERFAPVNLYPEEPWNYAVCTDAPSRRKIAVEKRPISGYPFENPPWRLRIPVKRISAYDELAQGQCTPPVPLFYRVADEPARMLELVPFGATTLRIGAFPDTVERTKIPLALTGACFGELRAFDFRVPLADHRSEYDFMTPEEFRKKGRYIDLDPDSGAIDLRRNYQNSGRFYVDAMFMFHSLEDCDATLCVSASMAAVGYLDGKKVCDLDLYQSYRKFAPEHFKVRLKSGVNCFRFKIASMACPWQYLNDWGIKLELFR